MRGGLLSCFVHTQPFPRFVFNALSDLKGSWEAATGWRRSSIVSSTSTKLQVWEEASELMQKSKPESQGSVFIATPVRTDTVSDSLHASARLQSCADKVAAQRNETSFGGDKTVCTGQHSVEVSVCSDWWWWGGVHYAEMKRVSAARAAGSNTSSYSTRVQDISCYIATLIWTQ